MFERGARCTLRLIVVAAGAAGLLATGAQAANAPGQPVAVVGPVSSPGGGVTASGSATSGGKADACLNNQHSGANPSGSQPAQVNDRGCKASSSSSGGTSSSGSGSSAQGGTQSGAAPQSGARSGAAGTTSSKSGASKKTASVAASGARGLRITGIHYQTSGIPKAHQLGVLVSLRDELGRPIRDAVVTLGSRPGTTPALKTRTAKSNSLGIAKFTVPTTSKMLGKRLQLQVGARTATTRLTTLSSVMLPHGSLVACKK